MTSDVSSAPNTGRIAPELLLDSARRAGTLSRAARAADGSGGCAAGGEVARGFEEILATTLVREMRRTLSQGFFGEGAGADTYSAWLDEHVGRALAERGVFGLRGMIEGALGRGEVGAASESLPAREAA